MEIIETGADKLIELVDKKGRITIDHAAKELKVNKDQINKWAEVLIRNRIISVYYPLTGDGILTKGVNSLIEKGLVEEEKETGTSDDLVKLMKNFHFLKYDRAVKKLNVEPDIVKKWVKELEDEDVIETETFFFGDIGIMKSDNFAKKLAEIEENNG